MIFCRLNYLLILSLGIFSATHATDYGAADAMVQGDEPVAATTPAEDTWTDGDIQYGPAQDPVLVAIQTMHEALSQELQTDRDQNLAFQAEVRKNEQERKEAAAERKQQFAERRAAWQARQDELTERRNNNQFRNQWQGDRLLTMEALRALLQGQRPAQLIDKINSRIQALSQQMQTTPPPAPVSAVSPQARPATSGSNMLP